VERLGTEAARVLCFVQLPDHRPQPQALQAWLQRRFGDGEGEGGRAVGPARSAAPAAAAPVQGDLFDTALPAAGLAPAAA